MTVALRSVELCVTDAAAAASFMTDIWGMADAQAATRTRYLRGSGRHPYLIALEDAERDFVRSVTFTCSQDELPALEAGAARYGLSVTRTQSTDPGGGHGLIVELPEGEIFRFLAGSEEREPLDGRDLPVRLTHVVVNATDAEASARVCEQALGFKVSDRTKGMVFVRCNSAHHSTAFARAGFSSLNHIAFEMVDIDSVMRGVGRLRNSGMAPAWGPGRHGPGNNVFAYFVAPFGPVVEFSTAVEQIPEDYAVGAPDDWTWPEKRIDHWGVSDKDMIALREAEERFRFAGTWVPQRLQSASARDF